MKNNNSVTEQFKMKVVFSITLRDNRHRKVELSIADNLKPGKYILEITLLLPKEEKLNLVIKKIKDLLIISGDLKFRKILMDKKSNMQTITNKDILLNKDLCLLLTKASGTMTTLPPLNL